MPRLRGYFYPQMVPKLAPGGTQTSQTVGQDSPSTDAFGRLRISEPFAVFHHKQVQDNLELLWDEQLSGSASSEHKANDSLTNMVVSASGDFVIHQQKAYNNYQSGKSQQILMTGRMPPETDVEKRIGYFTGEIVDPYLVTDGLYFSAQSGTFYVNTAKNGAVEAVPQSSWNLDPLDGTGPSGAVLDKSKAQIFVMDFGWLGFDRVRMGFFINGKTVYAHQFLHANAIESPYLTNPNLPVRYEVRSLGGVGEMDHVCTSVLSEGGTETLSILRAVSTENVEPDMPTADTIYAVLGIRLKSGSLDGIVDEIKLSMIAETNDNFRWMLLQNPTLTGTFTYSDLDLSVTQVASGSGDTITIAPESVGIVLDEGYTSRESKTIVAALDSAIKLGSTIDGQRDEIVLAVHPLGNNQAVQASLKWKELL